jgi:hypothetical protein
MTRTVLLALIALVVIVVLVVLYFLRTTTDNIDLFLVVAVLAGYITAKDVLNHEN